LGDIDVDGGVNIVIGLMFRRNSSFHSCDYEEFSLVEHDAMQSVES
jgi:hypothetical protein